MKVEELKGIIEVARGVKPADIILKGAKVVNVFSGEIENGDVAILGDRIVGVGDYEGEKEIDLDGGYLVPGLIDSHVHIESSMVSPVQYARGVLPCGTTTVFADPHEITNVMGIEGFELMLKMSEGIPLKVFLNVPSCVPATHMETSGACLEADAIAKLLREERVSGLAEMMNYPGVLFAVPDVLAKLEAAEGRIIDGHAPGLTGKDLDAYVSAGVMSDHECTEPKEALEKLSTGMHIMIREGTGARNLDALLPMVTTANERRIMFASDDLHPPELLNRGHINYMVRRAMKYGREPVSAIRMGSLNAAEYFRKWNLGAIAPGYIADIVWMPDLKKFEPQIVWANGRMVVDGGEIIEADWMEASTTCRNTMNPAPFTAKDFQVKAGEGARAHVIGLVKDQIVTENLVEELKVEKGLAVADVERDILKICVIERHKATGNIGIGFVKGFGLQKGALASSVGHDAHNLIVVGTNDADMELAAKHVVSTRGGFAAASDGKILGSLELPIAGLMSYDTIEDVDLQITGLKHISKKMGCRIEDPFMLLGFLALEVIPHLKLTDMGLVDVDKFEIIKLMV